MDERAAYSDSSRRSEQLSCRKHFHPSYGLKDMNFQSLVRMLAAFAYHANLRKRGPNVIFMNSKGESKNMRLM